MNEVLTHLIMELKKSPDIFRASLISYHGYVGGA